MFHSDTDDDTTLGMFTSIMAASVTWSAKQRNVSVGESVIAT